MTHNIWYHGLMPRDEVEDLLRRNGDFVVRKTEFLGKPRFTLSVSNRQRIRHILFKCENGQWFFRDIRRSTPSELIEAHVAMRSPVQSDGTILENGIPRPEFYILHEHIEIVKKLGGGAFGEVYTGIWKRKDGNVDVAVKTLKGIMHKKQRAEFMKAIKEAALQEAKLMKRFDHKNIVRLYGVAPQEEPIMIILEYAAGGSLKSHLRNCKSVSVGQLIKYVIDAARGMCYLSGRQVIHRDIAARNCLLGKQDEVKIADFGLSVADISFVKQNKLKSMPIKWLSPETLRKGEFSKKTDVWSFGVLIWEIFTRCSSDPFPHQTNAEAKAKV
ncbi:unnamed protein product [Toxocara canis]|uniref:Tyrosine-protein kinase n=1 Tax=Toxocara canis TaxID=6265 RepID=A0A183V503_TOXCA|nr:unnamed protein product [Toxocara canis]